MKTTNQFELAATVAARRTCIASFDKRVIGETKGNVASLPPDFEIATDWDVPCLDHAASRAKGDREVDGAGVSQASDAENCLEFYGGQLGR
jgi:hypothetical protein